MRISGGSAYPWGTVVTLHPPAHLAMDFTLAQDADHPSRIDNTFTASRDATRERCIHDRWTATNLAVWDKFNEWPSLLDRYAALTEENALPSDKPEDEP